MDYPKAWPTQPCAKDAHGAMRFLFTKILLLSLRSKDLEAVFKASNTACLYAFHQPND